MMNNIINAITFPLRALFLHEEGRFGLMSLREERMQMVARFCTGRVLDVGCGPHNLFIKNYIGLEHGTGVDIFPYEGVEQVVDDMAALPFAGESFDTVTLIAVGGHIPKSKREAEFREFARVLKPGGKLIMTEGEPITQYILHKWVALYFLLQNKRDLDSERGMEEDEEYCMPTAEIMRYLNTPPLKFVLRKRFMWGLNNVYVALKQQS
jgi:SAM-dependent methyltransferase